MFQYVAVWFSDYTVDVIISTLLVYCAQSNCINYRESTLSSNASVWDLQADANRPGLEKYFKKYISVSLQKM